MVQAVVLAAGLGTRMRSPLAKVLHPLSGRPMLAWILEALQEVGAAVVVVVGHQAEATSALAASYGAQVALQDRPLGTGHALRAALPLLGQSGSVLVTAGDTPLLTVTSLKRLLSEASGPCTVASMNLPDPTGYGRILRNPVKICEQAECSPEQARITEVNSGLYVFDAAYLHQELPQLQPHLPKGEFYLTDLVQEGSTVVSGFDPTECMGINDRAALAEARSILRRRINRAWALSGVDFLDLDSPEIEAAAVLEPGAQIGHGAVIRGNSRIGGEVGPFCELRDAIVPAGARILAGSHVEGAVLSENTVVGPMARLRPGTLLHPGVRVGNFVEVKQAILHKNVKANHLSYLGDAEIGADSNIGAGTITCNYDGFRKNKTLIGERSFIGSNTALVAPIQVGADTIVGAGTTLTESVPEGAIAVARPELKIAQGATLRLRKRLKALKEQGQ